MSWGVGNKLIINGGFCHKNGITPIMDIHWQVSLYHPICRKLINVSNGIFLSLQKVVNDSQGSTLKPHSLKLSMQYRSVIKDCIDDFNKVISESQDETEKQNLDFICQVFYKIELIWNLCEIIVFDDQPGRVLLHQLLSWIRWHFTSCDLLAKSVIDSGVPEIHEEFWNAVYGLCFQGRFEETVKMLELHSCHSSPSFQCMIKLLKKAPLSGSLSSVSSQELEYKWYHWRNECSQRYQAGEVSGNPHLETLIKVLLGDDDVFDSLMPLFDTWYQFMVSRLLFTDPNIKLLSLGNAAHGALDRWKGNNVNSALDNILLALCDKYILEAIQGCQSALDNSWFTAHLCDLLHHAGHLEANDVNYSLKLRESLLLDYSALLMSHPSLWQVGVDYADHCPTQGHAQLHTYLQRLPLTTELKANKIIAVALERNMNDVASSICRVLSRRCLKHKRLGSALTWALRAADPTLTSHIADQYLHLYIITGSFSNLDLLDHLGTGMLISNRLIFLGKYREFQLLSQEDKRKEAANLLIDLISSNLSPLYFSFNLLQDAIPLLQVSPPVFTPNQTWQLMTSVESIVDKTQFDESLYPDKSQTIKLLRVALAENLANSMIKEGSE